MKAFFQRLWRAHKLSQNFEAYLREHRPEAVEPYLKDMEALRAKYNRTFRIIILAALGACLVDIIFAQLWALR